MQLAFPRLDPLLRPLLPDMRARSAFEPLSLPLYRILLGAGILIAASIVLSDFEYDAASLNTPLFCLAVLALCGMGLRRVGYPTVGALLEVTSLMTAMSAAAAFGSLIVAAGAASYADAKLLQWDATLFFGFDWRTAVAAVQGHDRLLSVASHVYSTLNWQPALLILLLLATGRVGPCWTFATAWAICLAFTVAIFPFVPALGGYLHFGISPSEVPGVSVAAAWRHAELLEPVREGTLRLLTARTVEGVVTFPSFHAAAAVLLGWGYWRIAYLRWPFALLNAAMFASSVVIGGHYLVDLLAGGLLAATSILIAWLMLRPRAAVHVSPVLLPPSSEPASSG